MNKLKLLAYSAAAIVFVVCVGLVYFRRFVAGSGVTDGGWDDPVALYFAAKGVFCSVALVLLYHIYEAVAKRALRCETETAPGSHGHVVSELRRHKMARLRQ